MGMQKKKFIQFEYGMHFTKSGYSIYTWEMAKPENLAISSLIEIFLLLRTQLIYLILIVYIVAMTLRQFFVTWQTLQGVEKKWAALFSFYLGSY